MPDDTWDKSQHVSMWPKSRLPEQEELRPAYMWVEEGNYAADENGEVIHYLNALQFIKELSDRRIILFVHRLLVKSDFSHFDEILEEGKKHDKNGKKTGPTVCAYATRSQGCVGVYIKSKRSAWIVERRIWDDGVLGPNQQFLRDIRTVFELNHRSAATPGSLGEKKIREYLPKGTRYSRPSHPLRSTLLRHKVGGRADTTELKKQYGVLYEEDINGAYPFCALETIDPEETPTGFGSRHTTVSDDYVGRFFSYFAHAHVVIPTHSKKVKFGPLPYREKKDGRLSYPTTLGMEFSGWWWKEELDRARRAGYVVTIQEGWGWRRSSNWLAQWAQDSYNQRHQEGLSDTVRAIEKRKMVSAIGRFGIAPETLTLVSNEEHRDGDIPVSVQTYAWECVEKQYWIHIEPNIDNPSLNHINSYIVAKARSLLYDHILQEEQTGATVVASNYDCYYLTTPTKRRKMVEPRLGSLKEHTITNAYIHAPRYIKGVRDGLPIDNRPGTPKKARDVPTSSSASIRPKSRRTRTVSKARAI